MAGGEKMARSLKEGREDECDQKSVLWTRHGEAGSGSCGCGGVFAFVWKSKDSLKRNQ